MTSERFRTIPNGAVESSSSAVPSGLGCDRSQATRRRRDVVQRGVPDDPIAVVLRA